MLTCVRRVWDMIATYNNAQNFAVNAQYSEMGDVSYAGYPDRNIGDILMSGGPIISSITFNNSLAYVR